MAFLRIRGLKNLQVGCFQGEGSPEATRVWRSCPLYMLLRLQYKDIQWIAGRLYKQKSTDLRICQKKIDLQTKVYDHHIKLYLRTVSCESKALIE